MKDRLKRIFNCIWIVALVGLAVNIGMRDSVTAEATTINQVQQNIKDINKQLEEINKSIANAEAKQDILEEEMEDLNAEIINTMTSIGMKEDEIAEKIVEIDNKQSDIDDTSNAFEEAKERETEQYQDMVVRLCKMYENGEDDYASQMVGQKGLAGILNRLDYVEKVYEYDRLMFENYKTTKDQVLELWNQLEEEKIALESAKSDLEWQRAKLEEQKADLNKLLDKKKKQSANYEAEIKKAKQEASVAKRKLQQEQQELKRLQAAQQTVSNAANGTYTTDYNSVIDSANGSDLGKQIAKYACQYVGNPYVAGGTSLTNGADCSGFTFRVYSDFGYRLPRTSTEQRSAGTGVNYSDAQPGDLICYSGHVAMYIGNGLIVHASTAKTGIKVSNAGYKTILAVRRII